MKSLKEFAQTSINEENGRWIRLFPVVDIAEQINAVRVGEFFEIDNRAYFGNVKEFINKYVCEVKRPYDNYDTARKAIGNNIGYLEVCWVYDSDDNVAYIAPRKEIKNIR